MRLISQILTGATLLSTMLFASCQRTAGVEGDLINPIDTRDGSFSIVGNLQDYATRAHDTEWNAGDRIGVFAYEAGKTTILKGYSNLAYTTVDKAGVFKAANGGVVLTGSEKADITAYYPYSDQLQGTKLSLDIKNQADPKALDLLRGKSAVTADASTKTLPVKFNHCLSLVQIRFKPKEGATLPKSIKATLKGATTAATFDVADGALTNGEKKSDLTLSAKDGSISLILLPGQVIDGFEFEVDGTKVPYSFKTPYTLKANTKYTFSFTPNNGKIFLIISADGTEGSISDWGDEVTFEDDLYYGKADDPDKPGMGDDPENPAKGVLAFPGADFETMADFGKFGLKDSKIVEGKGVNDSKALQISGTPKGNNYVFSTPTTNANAGKSYSKLTFMMKGTAKKKSLSINVYNNGGKTYDGFNLGIVTGPVTIKTNGSTKDKKYVNLYDGNIDTKGEWVLVTLDLTGVELNTSGSGNTFAFKDGKEGDYDLYIDDIRLQ